MRAWPYRIEHARFTFGEKIRIFIVMTIGVGLFLFVVGALV